MISRLASRMRRRLDQGRGDAGPGGFFLSGTGRCGTMLLSRILSLGENAHCDHEGSIDVAKLTEAYETGRFDALADDVARNIVPRAAEFRRQGVSFGISSAHLFPVLPALDRHFGEARFVLLVRRPDTFVASALARGFFDSSHPNGFQLLRPPPGEKTRESWHAMLPFERCLWYWTHVNGEVLKFLRGLPSDRWRMQRIEDLDLEAVCALFEFLDLRGFERVEDAVRKLLRTPINATPQPGEEGEWNPFSRHDTLPTMDEWSVDRRGRLAEFCRPLVDELYPELLAPAQRTGSG